MTSCLLGFSSKKEPHWPCVVVVGMKKCGGIEYGIVNRKHHWWTKKNNSSCCCCSFTVTACMFFRERKGEQLLTSNSSLPHNPVKLSLYYHGILLIIIVTRTSCEYHAGLSHCHGLEQHGYISAACRALCRSPSYLQRRLANDAKHFHAQQSVQQQQQR